MSISCESHGGKSTMLVGSMFHWHKAKRPKCTRISIWRLEFFCEIFAKSAIFRKAAVSKFCAKGSFLKKSSKNREIDNFWGPNFALRAIFKMADIGLVRA